MFQVDVDKDKCTGCVECVNSCPASVLELVDKNVNPLKWMNVRVAKPV